MSTIPITPGSGRSIQTYQDGSGNDHPAGVMEILVTGSPVAVSTANPVPVSLASAVALGAGSAVIGHVIVDSMPSVNVTGTFWQATQPVSATSLPLPTGAAQDGTDITTPFAMPAGGSGIRGWLSAIWTKLNASLAVTGTVTANVGTTNGLALDATLTGGSQRTKLVDSGGTNVATVSAAGAVKVDGSAVTQPVSLSAATSGGSTPYSYLAAASANQDSQVVKASAGQVYGWHLFNNASSARFVKVYDKATAPTSADTPAKRYMIPANGGVVVPQPSGVAFANGIAFRITQGIADSDATAATAADVIVNCNYK